MADVPARPEGEAQHWATLERANAQTRRRADAQLNERVNEQRNGRTARRAAARDVVLRPDQAAP
ncbi:hypothetical protein WME89_49010 [Sorangium sp. So ce321]|uniref:hypothetical protein n=1 Tax=Sorangium sp. So ce321 TaxID=3133300 RepID=UPI003F5E2513